MRKIEKKEKERKKGRERKENKFPQFQGREKTTNCLIARQHGNIW